MNYAHTFTHLQLDRCVQNGHLNTKTIGHLSFSYELLAITWISMYSGGHLLSAILYLCCVASWDVGDTKYELKGVETVL